MDGCHSVGWLDKKVSADADDCGADVVVRSVSCVVGTVACTIVPDLKMMPVSEATYPSCENATIPSQPF